MLALAVLAPGVAISVIEAFLVVKLVSDVAEKYFEVIIAKSALFMPLSMRGKAAISSYLFNTVSKWVAVFGVVNILAIFGSLGYVFFILPKKASDDAQVALRQEMRNQTEDLTKMLEAAYHRAGQLEERSTQALAKSDKLLEAQSVLESKQHNTLQRVEKLGEAPRSPKPSQLRHWRHSLLTCKTTRRLMT